MEALSVSYDELGYIKAIVNIANSIKESVSRKELNVSENIFALHLMEQIRKIECQKAAMSLCRRICEAQDIKFANIVERVKLLYLEKDEFPEAKGLIEVIDQSSLDTTSVVSLILAEDFKLQYPSSIIPTQDAILLENKVQ